MSDVCTFSFFVENSVPLRTFFKRFGISNVWHLQTFYIFKRFVCRHVLVSRLIRRYRTPQRALPLPNARKQHWVSKQWCKTEMCCVNTWVLAPKHCTTNKVWQVFIFDRLKLKNSLYIFIFYNSWRTIYHFIVPVTKVEFLTQSSK